MLGPAGQIIRGDDESVILVKVFAVNDSQISSGIRLAIGNQCAVAPAEALARPSQHFDHLALAYAMV